MRNYMYINHIDIERLYNLAGHVYWKDASNGTYQGSNDYPAMLGINDTIQFLGNNDHDLLESNAAFVIRQNDDRVINQGRTFSKVEHAIFKDKKFSNYKTFTHKQPLYNLHRSKVIGVWGISFIFTDSDSIEDFLEKTPLDVSHTVVEHIRRYHHDIIQSSDKNSLTPRQMDCLYYLVLGKTAKETANILQLSKRTVEHHLNLLKLKYRCTSRSALITYALQMQSIREKLINT